MPYVNIKVTDEAVSLEQKSALVAGVTELLATVLGKEPATTFVVIDEVALDNWGVGGLPVAEYRAQRAGSE